ncbi:MAG: hypothetical protein ACR2OH_07875 [Microthrixaceae bacterium]
MFNTINTAHNNTAHNNTASEATESFLVRNGRRFAAVAFIALAGSAGISGVASAKDAPAQDGKDDHAEMMESDYAEPHWSVPDHGQDLIIEEYDEPLSTLEDIDDLDDPKDPVDPEDPGETTTTTTSEPEYPEYPEYPEDEYPEYPEVEGETVERTGGKELAYTGSDSKLPLVGGGLVVAGGLAAGASVLSRRAKANA